MKSVKLISSAIAMLIGFVTIAQKKEIRGIASDTIKWAVPIDSSVQEKISGTQITPQNKNYAAEKSVIIHEPLSLASKTEPLFILDGNIITVSQFSKINPNDIESIKIIKADEIDFIRQGRGLNGIVLITLKKQTNSY
ncbi:hypothetical protein [Flavobacterium sp. H4147]|uniref:hypothetical protein n=1 Tax=Flavobacterium sp. H4147 TaxID=3034149 RepID=UPI0023ED7F58|nr:hypothetical protein [Flavobacterium sp. H4147]